MISENCSDMLYNYRPRKTSKSNFSKTRSYNFQSKRDREQDSYSCQIIFERNRSEISVITSSAHEKLHHSKRKLGRFSKNQSSKSEVVKTSDSDCWATTSASMITLSTKKTAQNERKRGGADPRLIDFVKKLSRLNFGVDPECSKSCSLCNTLIKDSLSELVEDSISLWENSERSSKSFKVS